MKKRILTLLLISTMAFCLAACGSSKSSTDESTDTTEAQPDAGEATDSTDGSDGDDQIVGMANPMVAVESADEFKDQLGITIDTSVFTCDVVDMYIISDSIAEINMTIQNVEGEEVDLYLRATKDADMAESLHGIYDEKMTDPYELEVDDITFTVQDAETEGKTIYSWNKDDIYYCFVVDDSLSQMTIGELLDQVMAAV